MNRNTILLETELYVRHDFSANTFLKNDALRYDTKRRGLFAEKLLLYDTIVIPTHDLGIIPVLITWIGPSLFEQLLDESALRFCRLQSFVAYGRGSGLVMLRIEPSTEEEREKSVFWGPTDRAIELQLMHTVPFIKRNRRTKLIEKALKQTVEEPLGDFPKIIMKETHDDVLNDIGLQAFFAKRRKKVDLARLPGIKSKEVRILGGEHPGDEIDFLLRLGEINMELALASNLKCLSVTTDPLVKRLIAAKIKRNLQGLSENQVHDLHERFCKILELNNLPDIPSAVANDEIEFDAIITLRSSSKGQQFRHWLANLKIQKPDDVVAMYLEVLTKKHWSQNWPVRTVRFIIAASLDILLAQAGIPLPAASAVDSFILDQFLKGYSPQLFLDELRNLWEEARKKV